MDFTDNNSSTRRRWLTTAQYICANFVAIVAMFAVDMPGGYLGGIGEATNFGLFYTGILVLLSIGLGVSRVVGKGWADPVMQFALGANIGVFVPPLGEDPVIAIFCLGWHLYIILQLLIPFGELKTSQPRSVELAATVNLRDWLGQYEPALRHASLVALVLTTCVVGYRLSQGWIAMASCLTLNWATAVIAGGVFWRVRYKHAGGLGFLAVVLVVSILTLVFGGAVVALGSLIVFQLGLAVFIASRGEVLPELLNFFYESPALLVVASFVTAICLGTILLTFPAATEAPGSVAFVDALFTATSAICVTGLIVVDTPTVYSFFGEAVILGLIQVGGLGIMVLSTFGTLLIGGELGLRGEQALDSLLGGRGAKNAYQLTIFIVLSTLAIEFIGAIFLGIAFYPHASGLTETIWKAVFHAVSAFCNAGFALQTNSIELLSGDPFALSIFAVLIVSGGLGFGVLAGLWRWTRGQNKRLSVQSKLALASTLFLIVTGTIVIAPVEWNGALSDSGTVDGFFNALFHSITLRTAGFNSIDMSQFRSATVFFFVIFMVIGGSPGSTAGGLKTTTAAILLGGVRASASGYNRVTFFGRRISQQLVYRSASIAVLYVAIAMGGLFLLLLTQTGSFEALFFEAFSAIGTVGLSLGATSELDIVGKILVSMMMFVGRVGPLTVALVLAGPENSNVEYPEADVMVG